MKELHILIVEDELSYAIELEIMLREMGFERLYLRDNFEAANQVLENVPIGLALLDINLQGRNRGLDLGKRTFEKRIPTIFISAFTDEKIFEQAQATRPIAYLNKPFNALTLRSLIKSVLEKRTAPEGSGDLFLKTGRQVERIPLDSILWIESDGNYCEIHTEKRRFAQKSSLKSLLDELPADRFLRVHKSFVVRLAVVKNFDNSREILTIGEKEIPVGRAFKPDFLRAINWR